MRFDKLRQGGSDAPEIFSKNAPPVPCRVMDPPPDISLLVDAIGSTAIVFVIPGYSYFSLFSWIGNEERRKLGMRGNNSSMKTKLLGEERLSYSVNSDERLPVQEKTNIYVAAA